MRKRVLTCISCFKGTMAWDKETQKCPNCGKVYYWSPDLTGNKRKSNPLGVYSQSKAWRK